MEPLTFVALAIFWSGFGHTVAVEQAKKHQAPVAIVQPAAPAVVKKHSKKKCK
jgi:hypothetical protein